MRKVALQVAMTVAVVWCLMWCLWGCAEFREPQLSRWNPPVADFHTPCPQITPIKHGPDAYDRAHGQLFHCETHQVDMPNEDVDNLGLW